MVCIFSRGTGKSLLRLSRIFVFGRPLSVCQVTHHYKKLPVILGFASGFRVYASQNSAPHYKRAVVSKGPLLRFQASFGECRVCWMYRFTFKSQSLTSSRSTCNLWVKGQASTHSPIHISNDVLNLGRRKPNIS